MAIVLWTTGYHLHDHVLQFAAEGLERLGLNTRVLHVNNFHGTPQGSISYGIRRGVEHIYKGCARRGSEWWNIDRGFFGALRTEIGGYYRIARRSLMPLFSSDHDLDDTRMKALGVQVMPWKKGGTLILVCPPTEALALYHDTRAHRWVEETMERIPARLRDQVVVREKDNEVPIAHHLGEARAVVAFNSNVALEALVAGIPAFTEVGIVQSWNRMGPEDVEINPEDFPHGRDALIRYATWSQYTIQELRAGFAWKKVFAIQGNGFDYGTR